MSNPQENAGASYAGVVIHSANTETLQTHSFEQSAVQTVNDTELSYSEGWDYFRLLPRAMRLMNNTYSASNKDGASAEYTFLNCERIFWYTPADEAKGIAEVYIDSQPVATVDCGKPGSLYKNLVFDSGSLPEGEHTIKIVVKESGGKRVAIDKLTAAGKAPDLHRIHNKNRAFVHYTAGFGSVKSPDNGQELACSDQPGEELEVYFYGPFIRFYGLKAPDGGMLELFIDGKSVAIADCCATRDSASELLFEANGLDIDRFHVLKAVILPQKNTNSAGNKIAVNFFEVGSPLCLITVMNLRTDKELEQMKQHATTCTNPASWQPVKLPVTVPLHNVKLNEGVFSEKFERNIQYLKESLTKPQWVDMKDPDRIWVDMLVASNEGRMLGGMGNTLRYIEDEELKKATEDILNTIERRQFVNGNGYFLPYESTNFKLSTDTWPGIMRDEEKNYDRAMLTKGMLAAGEAGFTQSYDMLRKFYDWFNNAKEYLPVMLLGSMGIQGSIAGPLVAHCPTGKPEDIQTNQKYYDMDWWLEYLAQGLPEAVWRFTLNRPHNYLLTSICALFEQYTATGEQKYLDACYGAWRIFHDYFQIPGGGISICEHFECEPKSYLITDLPTSLYETCGSVFWIDLNHRFLQLNPDNETYAAEIEKSFYNYVFSSQGADGKIRYFNHMNRVKFAPGRYNTCCEIQATAQLGQLAQYIYSLADDGLYINLFAASEIEFTQGGTPVKLTMETGFPFDDQVLLKVSTPQPVQAKIRIRIPSWTQGQTVLHINNKPEYTGTPGSYAPLERTWQDGDTIRFTLTKSMRYTKYTGQNRIEGADRYAFQYGPLLMAVKGPLSDTCFQAENEPTIKLDLTAQELSERLILNDACQFELSGYTDYSLVPYFKIENEPFTCFPALKKA